MKALQPTRHTDMAVWNRHRPHRQTDEARKTPLQAAEPLQTAETDKTSASKHRPFGRNFEQATEKTAVWHKGNTVFSPAAGVQNFRRNKQKAVWKYLSDGLFQHKRKPKEVSYTGNWFERIRGKNRAASSGTSLPLAYKIIKRRTWFLLRFENLLPRRSQKRAAWFGTASIRLRHCRCRRGLRLGRNALRQQQFER